MITKEMQEVLDAAWLSGIFSKSNLARSRINEILEAFERGWLTTQTEEPDRYGNVIHISTRGLMVLRHRKEQSNSDHQVF